MEFCEVTDLRQQVHDPSIEIQRCINDIFAKPLLEILPGEHACAKTAIANLQIMSYFPTEYHVLFKIQFLPS